ncbi:MAG: hypothetical protein MUE30_14655 [Spirosomaceae bacterium]|nr:hypothetical protein [Spirosomataceae bacterium]
MTEFPYIQAVSKRTGVTEAQMRQIFKLENDFHQAIMAEEDFDRRQKLYEHVYIAVGAFFNNDPKAYFQKLIGVKTKIARQLQKDIKNKALLDVGCGCTDWTSKPPNSRMMILGAKSSVISATSSNLNYPNSLMCCYSTMFMSILPRKTKGIFWHRSEKPVNPTAKS